MLSMSSMQTAPLPIVASANFILVTVGFGASTTFDALQQSQLLS